MLQDILDRYLELFPDERSGLQLLLKQISDGERLNDRRNFTGHVTGSAIILSPDKQKVLLIYHKLFDRWQQPGGHWESDAEANPLVTTIREAEEETGVKIREYLPLDNKNPLIPLDIDSHEVPPQPRKDEPAHWHHDLRYLFVANSEEIQHPEHEVNIQDAAWFPLDASETKVIKRCIKKLRALLSAS